MYKLQCFDTGFISANPMHFNNYCSLKQTKCTVNYVKHSNNGFHGRHAMAVLRGDPVITLPSVVPNKLVAR